MSTSKGFIKNVDGDILLPITRAELILDSEGRIALLSPLFLAGANDSNLPGLVTAEERALLTGSGNNNLTSLAYKILLINEGLYVNNDSLRFYSVGENNSVTQTPVKVESTEDIIVTNSENKIKFTLNEILSEEKTINTFIKNITVDKKGRVTTIEGNVLTNEDLPELISNKKLENVTTNSEITSDSNDLTIVNKKYVDDLLLKHEGVLTGALTFGGLIRTSTELNEFLLNSPENSFYKIAVDILDVDYTKFHDKFSNFNVKAGDTVIAATLQSLKKYVYIPSADETITSLTFKNKNNSFAALSGNINIDFDEIFNIISEEGNKINVELQKATSDTSGYLSSEDYIRFSSYAAKTITYTPTLTSGYEIGKLNFDNTESIIWGKDTISSLTLNANSNNINPYFIFTKGEDSSTFTFKGVNGIKITKSNNDILFEGTYKASEENNYLTLTENYEFKVKKGEVTEEGQIIDGVTDYREYINFKILSINAHNSSIRYESIDSLTDGTDYYYGSEKLKNAITI